MSSKLTFSFGEGACAAKTPERRSTWINARIKALAREMGDTAFRQAFELPIPWTDAWGKEHATTTGRPVAFHAMRGLAAHSNGFHTIRTLAILMSLLGTIDRPGGFRHKAPYPRHIVPNYRAFNDPAMIKPNTPLNAAPLGFPASPEELAVHEDGTPLRIDHAVMADGIDIEEMFVEKGRLDDVFRKITSHEGARRNA